MQEEEEEKKVPFASLARDRESAKKTSSRKSQFGNVIKMKIRRKLLLLLLFLLFLHRTQGLDRSPRYMMLKKPEREKLLSRI